MIARLNPYTAAPKAIEPLMALSQSVAESGLEHSLLELVKIRASQINGCAYCLHMHTTDARKAGESEARIYLLDAWYESEMYSDRERAALGWTEALTRVADTHAPDEAYQAANAQFSDEEIVKLTLAITVINAWNRLAIAFRSVHPHDRKAAAA